MYPCHAVFYQKNYEKEHCIGHINDKNLEEEFKASADIYEIYQKESCKCDCIYCMKCGAGSYYKNTEGDHKQRWTSVNQDACKIFMINDKIHRTLRALYIKEGRQLRVEDANERRKYKKISK